MDDILDHPQVREYLKLVRLQVLTPLSLLINIAATVVCALVVNPSIGAIIKLHPTSISPKPVVIAVYMLAIYAGQLGYCLLLVIVQKDETKKTITQGVGLSLVFANWATALWSIAWVLQWFTVSIVFQGIILLFLLYANIVLLIYHAPTSERPLDMMFIHAPMRFFLVLQMSLMFPLSLFVNLGLEYIQEPDGVLKETSAMVWAGFGVVFGTHLLGLLVVVLRRDIVWAVAGTWICASIWSLDPKPVAVYATSIIFTVLYPLCLFTAILYSWFSQRNEGQIVLQPDDPRVPIASTAHNHQTIEPPSYNHQNVERPTSLNSAAQARGPREIDENAVWG